MSSSRLVVRVAALGAAVLGLLTAPARAQQPNDLDKRLRAIEEKLDQLRPDAPPRFIAVDPKAVERTVELLMQARDQLNNQLEKRLQAYQDFRLKNPYVVLRTAAGPTFRETQLNTLDAKLLNLRQRHTEIEAQTALINQTLKDAKDPAAAERDARALLLLLQRRGVDVAAMRRAAGDGKAEVGAIELLRLYADSLRLETKELELVTAATEEERVRAEKVLRDLANYQLRDERYRDGINSARQLYESILKRLQEVNLVRDFGKP
jgi:hypothetical protein